MPFRQKSYRLGKSRFLMKKGDITFTDSKQKEER